MTNRQPYIPPDQVDAYNQSSFVNNPARALDALPGPPAAKKPARKPAAKAAKSK